MDLTLITHSKVSLERDHSLSHYRGPFQHAYCIKIDSKQSRPILHVLSYPTVALSFHLALSVSISFYPSPFWLSIFPLCSTSVHSALIVFFLLFQSFCPFSKSPCQLSSLLSSIYICLFLPCPSLTSHSLFPFFFLFSSVFPCAFLSLSLALSPPQLSLSFSSWQIIILFLLSAVMLLPFSASWTPLRLSPPPSVSTRALFSFSQRCSSGRVGRPGLAPHFCTHSAGLWWWWCGFVCMRGWGGGGSVGGWRGRGGLSELWANYVWQAAEVVGLVLLEVVGEGAWWKTVVAVLGIQNVPQTLSPEKKADWR